MKFTTEQLSQYIHMHADCIPVNGANTSAIYDLTRSEIYQFPSDYYQVIELFIENTLGDLLKMAENDGVKDSFEEFIDFLQSNELVMLLNDPSLFPPIPEGWDFPAMIQNAIVDVKNIKHNFQKIISDLDELGCEMLQIRTFSNLLSKEELSEIMQQIRHTSIQGVELIIHYNSEIPRSAYKELAETHTIISNVIIHSAPNDENIVLDFGADKEILDLVKREVVMTTEEITSEKHCGIINYQNLNAPKTKNFFELKQFNGCLNRKVSVDQFGNIRNCPSMAESYGHIDQNSLMEAVAKDSFKKYWHINKDQINTCKDCEFRYACTDCRGYLQDPADMLSKPLKCGYDPYSSTWDDWSTNKLNSKSADYYKLHSYQ